MRLKIKVGVIFFIWKILTAQLLVITPDDFYNNIQPLVQWKKEKGYYVFVRKLSQIGQTAPQIKSYIQRLSDSTYIRYCLLVGAINKVPSFDLPGPPTGVTDYYYGCLSNELVGDVLVGRLPASNTSELDVMVAKILSYEKNPPADTLYFKRALMVATSYVGGSGTPAVTALETKRFLRRNLLANGFLQVDTVFHPPYTTGESITSSINRGVLYVNGRGWGNSDGWEYPRFDRTDVANLTNGFKLPVITSFYCATGNFARNPCFGEVFLRAGTPSQPKGGILFFGPSYTTTSTRWNNFLDCAAYEAIFSNGITTAGDVFLYAKKELIKNFPLSSDSLDLRIHIQSYNILGDPTLSLWRGVPKRLYPTHPENLAIGSQRVFISTNLESCLVSLLSPDMEYPVVGWTNHDGWVYLDLNLPQAGSLTLTITKRDYLPYQVTLPVVERDIHCGLFSYEISGNGPGRQEVYLTVKNYGTNTAENVSGILRSDSPKAQVLDSLANFGNLPPNGTSRVGPLRIEIKESALDKETLSFSLFLSSLSRSFLSGFKVEIRAQSFSLLQVRVDDGNNQILEPGEQANLFLKLKNTGREGGEIFSLLRPLTNAGSLSDSFANFGYFSPNEEKENLDPFNLYLAQNFSGNRKLKFRLFLFTPYGLKESLDFLLPTGPYESERSYGPSLYGYYAYENTDYPSPQRPNYSWVEIDPNYGGQGERLNLTDDGITTLNLPFPFRYFGINFDQISIGADGYLILGESQFKSPYNFNLPSPYSPNNILAIFWDDFRPDTGQSSGVYHYYDQTNHRYIIEWSRIHHIHGFRNRILGELQTFEIILLDPNYYPTRTGDGEIIYQYLYCQNDDSLSGDCHNYATVGILNPWASDYLLITFANWYPVGISPLAPERAIKFTTNPPDTFSGVEQWWPSPEARNRRGIPTVMKARDFIHFLSPDTTTTNRTSARIKVYDALGRRVNLIKNRLIRTGIYYIIAGEERKKLVIIGDE